LVKHLRSRPFRNPKKKKNRAEKKKKTTSVHMANTAIDKGSRRAKGLKVGAVGDQGERKKGQHGRKKEPWYAGAIILKKNVIAKKRPAISTRSAQHVKRDRERREA